MRKVVGLKRIRKLEEELLSADPKKAAKLAREIAKQKSELFKNGQ